MKPTASAPEFLPDFGKHLAETGTPQKKLLVYTTWELYELSVVGEGRYCTTRGQISEGKQYCATFDFDDDVLIEIMRAATPKTLDFLTKQLSDDPSSIRTIPLPVPVSVGIAAVLGSLQQGLHDSFIPLVITEVFGNEPQNTY